MKKTYINPSMDVVEINTPQILAGSDPTLGGNWGSTDPVLGREMEDFEEDPLKWLTNQ